MMTVFALTLSFVFVCKKVVAFRFCNTFATKIAKILSLAIKMEVKINIALMLSHDNSNCIIACIFQRTSILEHNLGQLYIRDDKHHAYRFDLEDTTKDKILIFKSVKSLTIYMFRNPNHFFKLKYYGNFCLISLLSNSGFGLEDAEV